MISISFSLLVMYKQTILYLVLIKPFSKKSENLIILINEFILLTFYFTLSVDYTKIIDLTSVKLAEILIKIIIVALGFNIFIIVLNIFIKLFERLRKFIQNRSAKIEPTNVTIESVQVSKRFE